MEIEVEQIGASELSRYAEIPIRYRVCSVLRVEAIDAGLELLPKSSWGNLWRLPE